MPNAIRRRPFRYSKPHPSRRKIQFSFHELPPVAVRETDRVLGTYIAYYHASLIDPEGSSVSIDAQYEFREGFKVIDAAIIEQLSGNGIAINADGITHKLNWQPGAPVPSSAMFEVTPTGRKPVKLEFSNVEIEDCWEGLHHAEVRRKLREMVEKYTIVDRKQPEQTQKQRFDEASAVMKMKYPRIHQNIVTLWGTAQGETFLDGLIMDDRGGRQGFPREAMAALLVLQRVHFQQFGTFKSVDAWDLVKHGKKSGR